MRLFKNCLCCAAGVLSLVIAAENSFGQGREIYVSERNNMVDEAVIGAGVKNKRVIEAMRKTPRHEFVTRNLWSQAYYDMALPIGQQQTISSPFIVAYMTESIDPQPDEKVLEIGTGSGYQAAVLSPLAKEVYSIEIVPELGRGAARTLKRLKYKNVHVKVGDGFKGWPEHAPFDKIIVTCSPEKVPRPLIDQLREGGRMVIPVGERYQQSLYLLTKENGELVADELRPTLFVPMTGTAEDARRVQPDGKHPKLINGGFEEDADDNGHVPGWYYQRQQEWINEGATLGDAYLGFENNELGRASHAMQGFAIDGRHVSTLEFSAWVMTEDVQWGRGKDERPRVVLTLYDEQRKHLGTWWIGPWHGDSAWHEKATTIRVPPTTREGILRLGLFGAKGKIGFDEVKLTPNPRQD